jgi:hypothetical protein
MAQLPSFGHTGHAPLNWASTSNKSSTFQYPPGLFPQPPGLNGFSMPQPSVQKPTEPPAPFEPYWQQSGLVSPFPLPAQTGSNITTINTQHPPSATLHLKSATAGAQQSPSPIAAAQRAPLPDSFPQSSYIETSAPLLHNGTLTMGKLTNFTDSY